MLAQIDLEHECQQPTEQAVLGSPATSEDVIDPDDPLASAKGKMWFALTSASSSPESSPRPVAEPPQPPPLPTLSSSGGPSTKHCCGADRPTGESARGENLCWHASASYECTQRDDDEPAPKAVATRGFESERGRTRRAIAHQKRRGQSPVLGGAGTLSLGEARLIIWPDERDVGLIGASEEGVAEYGLHAHETAQIHFSRQVDPTVVLKPLAWYSTAGSNNGYAVASCGRITGVSSEEHAAIETAVKLIRQRIKLRNAVMQFDVPQVLSMLLGGE